MFKFSMRQYMQYQLNSVSHFLQTTECANVQG